MPLARTRSRRKPGKRSAILELLAQVRLHDLAVMVLGEAIDEAIFLGTLEARDALEAKAVQLVHGRRRAARHHEGHDDLAPLAVGPPYDARLRDRGMGEE